MISRWIPSLAVILAVASVAVAPGCRPAEPPLRDAPSTAARKIVYVDNYPMKYFTDRIASDAVELVFPCPPGEDPAFWRPDAEAILGYQRADLILLNGATYAKWLDSVSLPESRLVDTSRAFVADWIPLEDAVVHQHGPGGEHAHQGVAFTTWLDPRLAERQAAAIHAALVRLVPDRKPAFDANFAGLQRDLEQLDQALSEVLNGYAQQPLLASHPVYQYLARRCAWNLKSRHWEPGEMPDERQWHELAALLDKHPAKWMIWESPPLDQVAERLEGMGVGCLVFEPCGNVPEQGDYLHIMRRNIGNLTAIVGES
jgi:zinc transport system substrate-binding protein